ncbi:autotransporter domain-containing protein [Croceicoccus marinus]|uniref:Autotransporter domain-containing protein n=1 Tax=Croceicoccus marinus TaxID=450378 RepID=A0A7G6VV97_9SPHN|nr:autotransporter domain-containing protein [Croceicoccus marinus]
MSEPVRNLLCSTAIVAIAISSTAASARDVTSAQTAPIATATANAGAPDAINITDKGSVTVSGGTTVTMNSNHKVTNGGKITITNANGSTGIAAAAGTSGDIVNSGTILLDEPYAPKDNDNDGDLDGPFALGGDRQGIRTLGAHAGNVVNSGTITVEGNDSAGIALGGTLTGDLVHDGKTGVIGDNAVGIDAQAIDGKVRLAGTVAARGENSVGARFGGDIAGAMVVQGDISASGYRYTAAPSSTTKLDADDLLQGGSAISVEGDVAGGIMLAVAPKDSDPDKADEDADGIDDAKEGSAKVTSFGKAAALSIGSASRDIAIGAVAGTASKFGLQVDGIVDGRGVYVGVDANGLSIGGMGHAVTIANGIGIAGAVGALSNGGNATAIRLGAGASTPVLQNSGSIEARGSSVGGTRAAAVLVEQGASLPALKNSGSIKAVAGAENGTAIAIRDTSGTLTLVENAGEIAATGAKAGTGRNIAIDLSAAAGNATVRQTQVAADHAAPVIKGDVLFAAGNDLLDLADGALTGDVSFGAGNDVLRLGGDAVHSGKVLFGSGSAEMNLSGKSFFTGSADFGGGTGVLSLADSAAFSGSLANSGNLAVAVAGGTLDITKPASIASLSVGATGVLVATLDKTGGSGTAIDVAGNASFVQGSKLALRLADVATAEGSYEVLTAGSITGRDKITTVDALVPFLFKAEIDKDAPANVLTIDVARRTVTELSLNRSAAAAYDAVFAAMSQDEDVEGSFLAITNGDAFRQTVATMLPDHAGGVFEGIGQGERTLIRQLQDPVSPIIDDGAFMATLNLALWNSDKGLGDSGAYDLQGHGFSLTGEYDVGFGHVGATLASLWNQHTNGMASDVKNSSLEVAAHWRGNWGPVAGFVRGALGRSDIESERVFTGTSDGESVRRTIEGKWDGDFVSFAAGASAEGGWRYLFFRPQVMVDYVRLNEDGYGETGGDEALDLTVDSRRSDELGLSAGLVLGADLMGMGKRDSAWLRIETEGGWREVLDGELGETTARFEDGEDFTLQGETSTSGWYGRLRVMGGPGSVIMGGELSAEERFEELSIALRGNMRIVW